MIPEPIPVLKGKAAKEFISQDKKPLTEKQRKFLAEAVELYRKHPVK